MPPWNNTLIAPAHTLLLLRRLYICTSRDHLTAASHLFHIPNADCPNMGNLSLKMNSYYVQKCAVVTAYHGPSVDCFEYIWASTANMFVMPQFRTFSVFDGKICGHFGYAKCWIISVSICDWYQALSTQHDGDQWTTNNMSICGMHEQIKFGQSELPCCD